MNRTTPAFGLTLLVSAISALFFSYAVAAGKGANERAFDEARELADKIKGVTNPGAKNAEKAAAGAGTSVEKLPKGDPCKLLTDAEVRKVFPKASTAKPERTREKYGIAACLWEHPAGRFAVQLMHADPKSTVEEARGLAIGFVDPLKPGAARNLRFEKIADVGEEAVAVVEQQDEKKGILADAAYLITQRGDRQIMILAMDLARADRAVALRTLADFGRAAAGRL